MTCTTNGTSWLIKATNYIYLFLNESFKFLKILIYKSMHAQAPEIGFVTLLANKGHIIHSELVPPLHVKHELWHWAQTLTLLWKYL